MTIDQAKEALEKYSPDETSALGEAIAVAIDLIDAEIKRQSVSGEDVDRTLDWLRTGKYITQVGDNEYEAITHFHPDTTRFKQTAITALEQMRTEPCDWCDWNHRFGCALGKWGQNTC